MLQQVKISCKQVAHRSVFVKINHDAIAEYARSVPLEQATQPEIDPDRHYLGHGPDTVAFFIVLDTINFGSGYFPHLKKRPGMSGYFTIASSLNDYFRTNGPLTPNKLRRITIDECYEIFHQDRGNQVIQELMTHFKNALNDLGRFVMENFQGDFMNLVASANQSVQQLTALLARMRYFQDVASYGDIQVAFYKRAQLTAADLMIAFKGEGPGKFNDLDQLTIFADNLVPHVLRVDGILCYDEDLIRRIDSGIPIMSGSQEEVEIRACAVHAVELIKHEIHSMGTAIRSMDLDYLLWNRGQQPYYKSIPRHRCRCWYY